MDSITISLGLLNELLRYANPGERWVRAVDQAFDGEEITIQPPTLAERVQESLELIKREEAAHLPIGRYDPAYPPLPRLPDGLWDRVTTPHKNKL